MGHGTSTPDSAVVFSRSCLCSGPTGTRLIWGMPAEVLEENLALLPGESVA